MRSSGLFRSFLSLGLCQMSWQWAPTDSIMDADLAATGYLPNHNMDPAIITSGGFGQIWSFTGPASTVNQQEQFYARPLVYTPSSVGKQVVIAFSEQNRIYVLDAVNGTLYTMRDLSTDGEIPFWVSDLGACNDISGTVGITGTPVIDNTTDTIYFWAKSYKVQTVTGYQNAAYRFHAVDAYTLEEREGFPTWVEGQPADNDNTRYFTGGTVLQRTSLNLINNVVYAGFGGHCDLFNYTGWVVGMRTNGDFVTAYSTSAGPHAPAQDGTWTGGGGGCGVWQAGAILSSDNPGRLFMATGNGYKYTYNGQAAASGRTQLDTLSETMVNMAIDPSTGVLTQSDYFEPYTYAALDSADRDVGSGGVSILPFSGGGVEALAMTCGKNGQCYVTDANNLGGYKLGSGGGDNIIQTITPPAGAAMFGNLGMYPLEGGYVYVTPVGSPTYAYALGYDSSGVPSFTLAGSTSDSAAGQVGAGSATVTTLDGQPGTAILWITDPNAGLRAYSAVPEAGTLTKIPLPATPVLPKFQRPVFGNGRYYLNTYTGQILGFGSPVKLPLNCGGPFDFGSVTIGSSSTMDITCTANVNINQIVNITAGNPLYQLSLTNVPQGAIQQGASFSFSVTFNLTEYVMSSGSTSSPAVQPGVQSGSVTIATLNGVGGYSAEEPISVTGTCVSSGPFADLSPVAVDFSPIVIGSAAAVGGSENSMVIENMGQGAMTILGYAYTVDTPTSPSAVFTNITQNANGTFVLDANGFFTTTDLPAVGSTMAAGSSLVVDITFDCSVLGDFYSSFVLWTDGGMVHSVLTGSADSQPVSLLQYALNGGEWTTIPDCADTSAGCTYQLDMGTSIGGLTTAHMVIRFTNNGGSDLLMDKSKPPEGSILGAENPDTDLSEGMAIPPGNSSSATVFFSPTAAFLNSPPVVYSGAWTLNVNDLTFGVHVLNFTGTVEGVQVGPTLSDGSPRFEYLGCYHDSTAARIETTSTNLANNTNGMCQSYAVSEKAAFAGTEYMTECWVGRDIPSNSSQVDDYLCQNYACPGDSTQWCGGVGGYMVVWYDVTAYFPANNSLAAAFQPPSAKASVGPYDYVGCYTDSTASRTLTGKTVGAVSGNTLESCAAACTGFTYFGTEYADECYCGDAVAASSAPALASTCSYTCAGDVTELCGGSSRISLYALNGTTVNNTSPTSSSSTTSTAATTSVSLSSTASLSTTSTSASTSTGSAATPTASLSCPASNGTTYVALNGDDFLLQCYVDHYAGDLSMAYESSYAACAETCSTTASCVAFSWEPGSPGPCYMKSAVGAPDVNSGVWGAVLVASSAASSAASSTASGTSSGTLSVTSSGTSSVTSSAVSSTATSPVATTTPLTSSSTTLPLTTPSSTSSSSTVSSSTTSSSTSSSTTSSPSSVTSSTSTGTSTASTPTASLSCPSSNGTIYAAPNGDNFLLQCYVDHFSGDLTMAYVGSYAACVDICSTTAGCVAFSWLPGSSGPCYMKSSVGAPDANTGVWGAVLDTSSLPSTSTSTSTSTTVSSTSSSSSSTSSTVSATFAPITTPTSSASTSSVSSTSTLSATSSSLSTPLVVTPSSTSSVATTTTTSASTTPSSSTSSSLTSSSTTTVALTTTSSTTTSSFSSLVTPSSTSVVTLTSTSSVTTSRSSTSSSPTSSIITSSAITSSSSSSLTSSSTTTSSVATSSSSPVTPPSTSTVTSTSTSSVTSSSSTSSLTSLSTTSSTSTITVTPSTSSTSSTLALPTSTPPSSSSSIPTSSAPASSSSAPPTATPSTTPSTGWNYLGCANDTTSVRALNATTLTNSSMTAETCQAFCASHNYPLAGTEYATQCYCGLGLAPGFALGQTGCTKPCGGNSSETCGGSSRLSLYLNESYVAPVVVPAVGAATFRGCFADSKSARLLSSYTWSSSTAMTVEACVAGCAAEGLPVSGVEYGGECYCGKAVPPATALAAGTWDCAVSFCTGNSDEFCGGGLSLAVYA